MQRLTYKFLLSIFLLLPYSKTDAQWSNTICNPIKIGNIEVAGSDTGPFTWEEANYYCKTLPDGWRLPTNEELTILYQNRDKLPLFFFLDWKSYWSSTKGVYSKAYRLNSKGIVYDKFDNEEKSDCRVVRTINIDNSKDTNLISKQANFPNTYEYFSSKSKRIEFRTAKKLESTDYTPNTYLFDTEKNLRLTPNYYFIRDLNDLYGNQSQNSTSKRFYEVNFTGEAFVSWGIINYNGKTVIPPIRDANYQFNFPMERIYQKYSICEEAYRTGKNINGHGVRCNKCKNDVAITKVYDFNFKLINTVIGVSFYNISNFRESCCCDYNFDPITGLYKLSKNISLETAYFYVDKDLKIIKDESPVYVQNKYGTWVNQNELASNKTTTPIESTTNQSNTDDELLKAILRFGNAVKASPKSTDAIMKDLEVEINREFNSSKTQKNGTKNKSNNTDAISQIMEIYWKGESEKINSNLKGSLNVGNARPSKNASGSSLSKSSSSNTASKHTFKVTVTWNNPNCGSCPFPRPSAQNGSIDYFYERSGSYKVKPKCPICGKTQYNTIDGFTDNIGTSNQGSKVVTISCN